MRVVFYEDARATQLSPIALTRPVFDLLCGCFSLRERVLRMLTTDAWGALVRSELCDVCREDCPDATINDLIALREGATLLINGRWLPGEQGFDAVTHDNVGMVDDQVAWIQIDATESLLLEEHNWCAGIARIADSRAEKVSAGGVMVEYPWDLVHYNPVRLARDIADHFEPRMPTGEQLVVLGDPSDVCVDPAAQIDPFVVLDARTGPICIDAGAEVQSFTRIEGPCYVGRDSRLFRTMIRGGTTIGPVCRVGGEIESSVLHGYVNKYHAGFLGHSYVCPWVNIGAMSTTSDLKNDYSDVTVPLDGTPIDSGLAKVGSFIGDHAKTAINSMFNTGSSIGVMAMVLPGGPLLPRYIPSFAVVWFGRVRDSWDLERTLNAARVAMRVTTGASAALTGQRLRGARPRTSVPARPLRASSLSRADRSRLSITQSPVCSPLSRARTSGRVCTAPSTKISRMRARGPGRTRSVRSIAPVSSS